MKQFSANSFNDIYVLHTAFIGDIFITFYFLDRLKKLNPKSKLHFITTPAMAECSSALECLESVTILDKRGEHKKISAGKKLLSPIQEDSLFISLHRSFRSSILALNTNSKNKIVFNTSSLSFLFKNRVKYKIHLHERNRLIEFLKIFNNYHELEESGLPILNLENIKLDNQNEFENSYLFFPGSVWATKKWKKEHFAETAKNLVDQGKKVFICGSKQDSEDSKFISNKSGAINIAGSYSLAQTMKIVSLANLVISNDSAPTHIADLLGTKVITLFGPTSPIFGFAPYNGDYIYLNKKCSPCNIHGPKKCPIGTHECMVDLTPDMVLKKIEEKD